MESPVVLDKPPEYHGNDRGFPFEEEEGSGTWSELAARHPDIAARLRQRPATATWARKRRPSSQDATDDFGESFSGFDRFPFDDIPADFREHFPSHWNRRFSARDEPPPPPPQQASPPQPTPQQHTAATQTELDQPEPDHLQTPLTQHGLRNTVDLGQKSPADPSLVDAEERNQRSMSAPPDHRPLNPEMAQQQQHESHPPQEPSNVRHIPIFVEGRDEPVINKTSEKQHQPAPPPPPHIDRDAYFADDGPSFHHPANFSRAFGTPYKGFRQGPQSFVQQKAYPQAAFNRGASPQRSQSPKHPPEEHYVKVPVHHSEKVPVHHSEKVPVHHSEPAPPPQPQHREPTPTPAPPAPQPAHKPVANDPKAQILNIQADVLDLMNKVEQFTGTKKDKTYLLLDEMLTRNLIKLDDIETGGKENIRQARKEAVRCIEKCIAVLESKAEQGSNAQAQDVDMKHNAKAEATPANGESEIRACTEPQVITETQAGEHPQNTPNPENKPNTEHLADATPVAEKTEPSQNEQNVENKQSPTKKVVKKRDKSKDKAPETAKDSIKETGENVVVMQVDNKGEKEGMEVDGAASQ